MEVGLVGLGAFRAAFQMLLDAVISVREKSTIFKPVLRDIKLKLDCLQPLIKDREKGNPKEAIEDFTVQMEEGVKLVHKCSKVGLWSCCTKYRYTSKLHELDKSLHRLLNVLKVQGFRDLKETLVSVRNIEMALGRIEGNLGMQNQCENTNIGWSNSAVPEPPKVTFGLDAPLKELKMKLFNDEVSMLVVAGAGGFGKTTLANLFCHDQEVKDKFKSNIFFFTLSKKPNLDLIVQELYERKGSQVPAFQNQVIAANPLQKFIKERGQKPFLFVLDDVWSGSEYILDKFDQFKMSNHKILVTSRFSFPRYGSSYNLESMNEEESMALFQHSASLEDNSSYALENLSRKILELCKGFPLAIKEVGRSLCGQPIQIWQKRVMEWSKGSSSIITSNQDLVHCLQRSLDDLDKEKPTIKECFLDLCSFPKGQRISVSALIDMWAELYDLDEDSLSVANLYELTNRSLANLVVTRNEKKEADGYYTEHFVTQHDMLRELAIHQMSQDPIKQRKRLFIDVCGDNFPQWLEKQKHQPIKARLLSISTDGDFSAKWPNLQLPEAEVLVLNFQTENYSLPKFVKKMDKLKVLIVRNHGPLPAGLENFELLGSLSNLKRIRLEHISIPSISKNLMKLKSLEKISLFSCNIGQAFSQGSIQILDAFPNLVEMNIDYCHDLVELPADLCDLVHLRKLSITNCHKLSALPEDMGNLVNLEVLRLRSCSEVLELPGSIRNLAKLSFLDISDCFSIKELPENIGELCSLVKLNLSQCSRLQELPASVLDLQLLKDVICDKETVILWEPFLPLLRSIQIKVVKEDFNLNWLHKFPS